MIKSGESTFCTPGTRRPEAFETILSRYLFPKKILSHAVILMTAKWKVRYFTLARELTRAKPEGS